MQEQGHRIGAVFFGQKMLRWMEPIVPFQVGWMDPMVLNQLHYLAAAKINFTG